MLKNSTLIIALSAMALVFSCGSETETVDHLGLAVGDDEGAIFTRACQQYFRGSLSNARENFNTLIYRFPDSPLRNDAQMAVRRIEFELSGEVEVLVQPDSITSFDFPEVAIVGTPAVGSCVSQLESILHTRGSLPSIIEDAGAPDVTLVLFPEGYQEDAATVADSLSTWLASHSSVPMQPGGDIIEAVAPDHDGVVVVIGTDASVDPIVLRSVTQ